MLGDSKAFSGFAVDDLEKAKAFYEDTLGLKTSEEHGLMTLHLAGDRPTIVYPKPGHEPANYTILNFPVDDIDAVVEALMERGVAFEIYEHGGQDDKGIMRQYGPPIAWFRDPREHPLGHPAGLTCARRQTGHTPQGAERLAVTKPTREGIHMPRTPLIGLAAAMLIAAAPLRSRARATGSTGAEAARQPTRGSRRSTRR